MLVNRKKSFSNYIAKQGDICDEKRTVTDFDCFAAGRR